MSSQKNQTPILVLAALITLTIIGAGLWWFTRNSSIDLSGKSETFAKVQNVPSGLFKYGGSTTWAGIRGTVDPAIQGVWSQFRLRYTEPTTGAPGSKTGIKMLLNNQLAFAQSSRPLKDEEYKQARAKGFRLKEIPVAIDGVAIAVNPQLNITGISVSQLKEIYTGKLTNWNVIGGPDLPIVAYSRRIEEGGTVEFFAENVLEGENFAANVQFIPTTTQAIQRVSNSLGGIYYASAPEIVPQCSVKSLPLGRNLNKLVSPYQEPFIDLAQCPRMRNQLNSISFHNGDYPITRRLFVIIKQNGDIEQQAGIAYANLLLTNQGQDLITKAGFVSIR